jgi:hypothetical protein
LLTCYDEIGIESGREAAHRGQKNVSVVVVAVREREGGSTPLVSNYT